MAEAEHVIRRTGGVGVMLEDARIGLLSMMVQAVEHKGRFAHRCRNDPRIERSVMAGHVRIEHRAGVDARPRAASGQKYCPSEDEVVPSSQIAAIGCLWCALTMAARAAT